MLFSISERLTLVDSLPPKGNFLTLTLLEELRRKLVFSDDEISEFNIKAADGRVTWDESATAEKEVAIGDATTAVIASALKKLNDANQLTTAHLGLCKKFGVT